MLLVIGGIKGGSGKTTLATNLAVIRARSGKKVLLVDADEQKSTWDWVEQRDTTFESLFTTVCLSGQMVHSQLQRMAHDYHDIIVDTGGRDTTSQRSALINADVFLIPFKPRSIDIWTIGSVRQLIAEVSSLNHKMRSLVFINQADPKGTDNESALEILAEYEEVKCLKTFIGNRKSFSNAAALGLSVIELPNKDEKAVKEIMNLHDEIYK